MTTQAGSQLICAIENVWKEIQHRNPDVPDVIATLAGSDTAYGHFWANRWTTGENGQKVHELFISGEGLARGATPTLGTLIHEATHALAHARGIKDTSRQGRYHNKQFQYLATQMGITVEHAGSIGYSKTSVPETTAQSYHQQIRELDEAITMWRTEYSALKITTPQSGQRLTCQCGRIIRCSTKVHTQGDIICSLCMSAFR